MSRRVDRYVRELKAKAERLEVPARVEERFAPYRDDPVRFAREVLRAERIPDFQEAVMRDVAEHDRVAWVAGHAVGKSHAAAILLAWYLITRPGCRCIVTSATYERQVGRVIFAKLRTLLAGAREELPIEVGVTRAQVAGHPEWSAEGVPATKPGNFAGFHASRMLVIADEAKALERPVFEELHGVLASATEEARLVLLSTAGPAQGYFYDAFSKRADLWRLHRTPSTESPFASGYADRMREETLGEEDPVYRMRVLAEFQEDVEGALIPLSLIHGAVGRELPPPAAGEPEPSVVFGVDVARFGEDRTVLAVARGGQVLELRAWRGLDTMRTAERIASEINARSPVRVAVDEIGLGAGVVDRLRQLGHHVEAVNVSAGPEGGRAYSGTSLHLNLRSEIGWRVRELFERGRVSLPDDAALVSELAALRYTYDARARIMLEPKAEAKKRLGRSPDLADAVLLALWAGGTAGGREPGDLGISIGDQHLFFGAPEPPPEAAELERLVRAAGLHVSAYLVSRAWRDGVRSIEDYLAWGRQREASWPHSAR